MWRACRPLSCSVVLQNPTLSCSVSFVFAFFDACHVHEPESARNKEVFNKNTGRIPLTPVLTCLILTHSTSRSRKIVTFYFLSYTVPRAQRERFIFRRRIRGNPTIKGYGFYFVAKISNCTIFQMTKFVTY